MHLTFSFRLYIIKKYYNWIKEIGYEPGAASMLNFLAVHKWLDYNAIAKYRRDDPDGTI